MQHIGLILYPEFQVLGLSMSTAFELANVVVDRDVYTISLLSENGGFVKASAGFSVQTEALNKRQFDTLIVMGDNTVTQTSPALVEFVKQADATTRRIGSICTGAYVLAEAGLLDGKRATTHWYRARDFQRAFPNVKVEEDRIFINDGKVWTSAGMSACVDLALALVEKDLGIEVARLVAKQLVIYHRRAGGQSQFSVMQDLEPQSDRIHAALVYAKENLKADLSVNSLADIANLSPRQFSRVFQTETGQSPAKAIENLRVEAARIMMEEGRVSVDNVAIDAGFGDSERMRRAFIRAFGHPPQTIRRANRV